MKTVFKILLIVSSCSSIKNKNSEVVAIVTKKEDLDKYLGKTITIKGEIINTKIPTIIGVDVSFPKIIKEGAISIATGVLIKTVVTDAGDFTQNRGNGTFYRLKNTLNDFDAEAQILD